MICPQCLSGNAKEVPTPVSGRWYMCASCGHGWSEPIKWHDPHEPVRDADGEPIRC